MTPQPAWLLAPSAAHRAPKTRALSPGGRVKGVEGAVTLTSTAGVVVVLGPLCPDQEVLITGTSFELRPASL